MTQTNSLTLTQPDDWHIHLRDDDALKRTVNDAAQQFNRVIVMPNLVPPVINVARAIAYRERIISALDSGKTLDPLMVLYLTDNTDAQMVKEAGKADHVHAFKWYPAGATTNSDSGVTSLKAIYPALEAMEKHDVVLAVHGEVTRSDVDIFDREARFIDEILSQVTNDFPELRVVFEHITTKSAVDFVESANPKVAATITAHHLLFNRNDMLAGGIKPHYYCLPILKRATHQHALLEAATSGSNKFFLGTDSAPHPRHDKEASCGCAGAYTAPFALELYAEAFDAVGALDKLEGFASFYGADFYQLPRNTETVSLIRTPSQVPKQLAMGDHAVVPILAGETLNWQFQSHQ